MTELAACPQCGASIPGDHVQCNVCNAVIRATPAKDSTVPAQPTEAEALSERVDGLRESFKTRRETTSIDAQGNFLGEHQGGRTPASPRATSATTPFRTWTGGVTILLLAAAIAAAIGLVLPTGEVNQTQQIESILAAASDSDPTGLARHLQTLSSLYGSQTVDGWTRAGARQSLAAASQAASPVDEAREFRRAATLFGSMKTPSVDMLEVAADAMNRAGDCHCELNDATAARAAFRSAEAHFTTILATDSGSPALRDRVKTKLTRARRDIERGCPTP